MKTKKFYQTLIFLLGISLHPFAWGGLVLGPQSKLWLEGNSTLHRFASTATVVNFSADVSSASSSGITQGIDGIVKGGLVKNLKVEVPVDRLKSGESGLDKNMRKALKGGEHPSIVFAMSGYRLMESASGSKIAASGTLVIAGAEKPVELSAGFSMHDGRIVIDGQQEVLMTDFGVKPPTIMFGAIKTDNRVVVKFHLELEQATGELKKNER